MKLLLRNNTALSSLTIGDDKKATITNLYLKGCAISSADQWTLIKSLYNSTQLHNSIQYITAELGAMTGWTGADLDVLYEFTKMTGNEYNYGRVTYTDGVYGDTKGSAPDLGIISIAVPKVSHVYDNKITAIQNTFGITITVTDWILSVHEFDNDSVAYQICINNFADSSGSIKEGDLAAVSSEQFGTKFTTKIDGQGITRLSWIKYFSALTVIPSAAFLNCTSLNEDGNFIWPNSLIAISDNAFANCGEIIIKNLPSSFTTISRYAFKCSKLTEIVIPDGVNTLPGYNCGPFEQCYYLTKVDIGRGLGAINDYVFYLSNNVSDVTLRYPDGVVSMGKGNFPITSNTNLHVPSNLIQLYKASSIWCAANITAIE